MIELTFKSRAARYAFSLLILAAPLVLASSAFGQGFMVQPLKMELVPRGGDTLEVPLKLRNTTNREQALDLRLVEVSQTPGGNWRLIEPDSDEDTSGLHSCKNWLTLEENQVPLAALEEKEINVRAEVPPQARGAYFAAIVVEAREPENIQGVRTRVRFLIPVILEIQGRPVRREVKLTDATLEYRPSGVGGPGIAVATVHVANPGLTFSRLLGHLRVEWKSGERWLPVSLIEIPESRIIPGVSLALASKLERRLPSGLYRLRAEIEIDGRRIAPLAREISYEGDPRASEEGLANALVLGTVEFNQTLSPGAVRSQAMQLQNLAEERVQVQTTAVTPTPLRGVKMGDLFGYDLSCAKWVQISPRDLQVRPGGNSNLRVVIRMPRDGGKQANYYATLLIKATYPDGQAAGESKALVCVHTTGIEDQPRVVPVSVTLTPDEADTGKYVLRGRFANVGNVHVRPRMTVNLLNAQGSPAGQFSIDGPQGVMLPMEFFNYAGPVSLAGVEPGTYRLMAALQYTDSDSATKSLLIRVEEKDGQKVIEVLGDDKQQEQHTATATAATATDGK